MGGDEDVRYRESIERAARLRGEGRQREAIDADLGAVQLAPRRVEAYLGLGQSCYWLNDWPNAVHWFDVARGLLEARRGDDGQPADGYGWLIFYTFALFHAGRIEDALVWSERGRELAPDDPRHRHNAALFASMVGPDELIPIETSPPPLPHYAVIPVRDRHEMTVALLDGLGLPADRAIVIDNGSAVPAREALAGRARIVEHGRRNLSEMWNLGLELAAAEQTGPHNVAILNNDLKVGPGFLDGLAAALRARPDHLVAYPDETGALAPRTCHANGRMTGWAFMVRGEIGLRADPHLRWWYGDDDLARRARLSGKVVRVGGVDVRHLAPNVATAASAELAAIIEGDQRSFDDKWGS